MKSVHPITFHYKVVRYIHDAFTGEFLNIGIVCFANAPVCTFYARLFLNCDRIVSAFPTVDTQHYLYYLGFLQDKFNDLAKDINSGKVLISKWPQKEISEILPDEDSSIQFGPIQGGIIGKSQDTEEMFNNLYQRLVEFHHVPSQGNIKYNVYGKGMDDKAILDLISRMLEEERL